MSEKTCETVSDRDLYYLRSIQRQLSEWRELSDEAAMTAGWGIGNEVLSDNLDWLGCFIERHASHHRSTPHE